MIRSKLGRFWRLLKEDIFPFCVGLIFLLSWLLSLVPVAYTILRGWFILCTGDVDFMPPFSVMLSYLGVVF